MSLLIMIVETVDNKTNTEPMLKVAMCECC